MRLAMNELESKKIELLNSQNQLIKCQEQSQTSKNTFESQVKSLENKAS